MLTNLLARNWHRTSFAIVDRDELLVFDWTSLEPLWQRKLPARIVGLDSINDGLIMVLDEHGDITHWDWQSGEARGGLSVGVPATGSSATFHGTVAVSTASSVVVIVAGQIVTTIAIPDLTALAWSPSGDSLAIGNANGEFVVYKLTDLQQLRDPKPIATMLFEKGITAIAWAPGDREDDFDSWEVVNGDSIWSIAPTEGIRSLSLQGLPGGIDQFAYDSSLFVVAYTSRVFVYSSFSTTVVNRTPTETQHAFNTDLAIPNERSKLVVAEIDYGDRFVTGIHLNYRHQLLVGLDQGEANLVNLGDEELFRTAPLPGRRAINLAFQAEFHSDNIPGLERLPEIDVTAAPRPTPAVPKKWKSDGPLFEAKFQWWTAPFLGIAVGGIAGVYFCYKAPQTLAIPFILGGIVIGFIGGLIVCAFDYFNE